MNRQFVLPLTPAKARMLQLMSVVTNLKLHKEIAEVAGLGRITTQQATELGLVGETERGALQFLIDNGLRAGLPFETGMEAVAKRVIRAALGFEDSIDLDDIEDRSFLGLVKHRRNVLLINLGSVSEVSELVGKVFPRIIIFGPITVQYSFPGMGEGKQVSTTDVMGQVLNPSVQTEIAANPDCAANHPRSLIAMGVFPGFWATDTWTKQVS